MAALARSGSRRGIEMQVLGVERYAELGQIGVIATERFDHRGPRPRVLVNG
jgi:hypothetical protein